MDIVVVGGGFVGVTTATVFAKSGHGVRLVEVDAARRDALADGRVPFYEPGLQEAFAGELGARLAVAGELGADTPAFVFLCVGTPSLPDGGCDTSYLQEAAAQVAAAGWRPGFTVVVKSTVVPGTTRGVVAPALSGLGEAGTAYGVAMNPEFLREGSALDDALAPDRVVCGALDGLARAALRSLYGDESCPLVETDPETAELVKYTANALLAAKVSFANEIARLAERVGVDVDAVMEAVGLDQRIGPHFLNAGPGYGGSCFPKDVAALQHAFGSHGVDSALLDAVQTVNASQPLHVADLADEMVSGLSGKTVAVLGLAFKADTSDVRETRALPLVQELRRRGAAVRCHDPQAGPGFRHLDPDADVVDDLWDCVRDTDLAVLHTDWAEYGLVVAHATAQSMRAPRILDTRRVLDPDAAERMGFEYRALGVGRAREAVEMVR